MKKRLWPDIHAIYETTYDNPADGNVFKGIYTVNSILWLSFAFTYMRV